MSSFWLTALGAIVLGLGCYSIMRLRKHSTSECMSFAVGAVVMVAVLSAIKALLF